MKTETTLSRPVRIVVIGAGNRAHKYLEYARRNPEQLRLAAIVEVNDLRRRAMADAFGLPDKYCYAHYDDFFAERLDADMVLISTPENAHSLEDRAVKKAFIEAEGRCTCPKDLPYCVCGAVSYGKIINKKPIIATKEEQEENSRSKSAKLRIFERK